MTYKIGLVQFSPKLKDNKFNRKRSIELLNEAIKKKADIIILPELCNSGLNFENQQEAYNSSEELEGETVKQWKNLAKINNVYIVAGFNERNGAVCYNSALLIGPEGLIGKYRKLHLVGWVEAEHFEKSTELPKVYDLPFAKVSLQVCYDVWFPEITRGQALEGANLICIPSNWFATPDGVAYDEYGLAAPHHLMISSSLINNVTFANASRVGHERKTKYIGGSCVINEKGNIIEGISSVTNEEVKVVEVKTSNNEKYYFNDLRKDIYKEIYN